MKYANFIFNNFGLKVTALLLALLVWGMIAGKARSYSERTLEVNVEYFNVGKNIDVRTVKPEKVRLKVTGTSKVLDKISPSDFNIKFDLKDVTEGTRLNYMTRDYLQTPDGVTINDVHPRRIEIIVKKYLTKEVNVRVRYKGRLQRGIRLISRKVNPEKVRIMGYKSQIDSITMVEATEYVNLSEIMETKTFRIPLKKEQDILRFEDTDHVDVLVTVENINKKNEPEKE
ncbi:MAG: hypothetical protein GY765_19120 [bacterium]|nr:hypothetical protein [bacterium]